VGDQRHAQDFFGGGAGFVGIFDDFDASAFAASPGVNLGFDNDGSAEFVRGHFGFDYGMSHLAAGHRYAIARKQGFGLIFMDLHVNDGNGNSQYSADDRERGKWIADAAGAIISLEIEGSRGADREAAGGGV